MMVLRAACGKLLLIGALLLSVFAPALEAFATQLQPSGNSYESEAVHGHSSDRASPQGTSSDSLVVDDCCSECDSCHLNCCALLGGNVQIKFSPKSYLFSHSDTFPQDHPLDVLYRPNWPV
jgi:hypothetical protein